MTPLDREAGAARGELARAKVNLFLHVTGRRADGYHELDSLAVFPPVGDHLHLTPAPHCSLRVTGTFGATLNGEPDNLVLRAARGFASAIGQAPALAFELVKTLPVASGIGGGSADAAAALRLLARHWNHPIPDRLALSLGADVPVCIESVSARMGGIGDIITNAPTMPRFGMVLVNPGVAISTPAIFRARNAAFSPRATLPDSWPDATTMAADLTRLHNDLQPPAIALAPAIGETLSELESHPSCLLARMSGSGATCFAIFASPAEAAQTAATLARPGWWTWGGHGHTP